MFLGANFVVITVEVAAADIAFIQATVRQVLLWALLYLVRYVEEWREARRIHMRLLTVGK